MYRYLLPFLLLLILSGCSSKKVDVDYDSLFQISSLSTFAVVNKNTNKLYLLDNERIIDAINREMESKGYTSVSVDKAEFHITFHSVIKEDVPSNVGIGLGLGTFSSGLGLSLGTFHGFSSDEGNLLINMLDSSTQKIFWQATLKSKIKELESPQERIEYFSKTVATMLEEFPVRSTK
ncbi:DUF4136 domain-containing protein [Sulfurimonas sp.]|uniref:DUF4136 domain-containing protein n=1 Tax=Sulfurimonas sp. TaxID=2022749 RepID=UPI0025EA006B|nr:DUF4136 domain-containing protein [Sulfurimonas sp.]MCK9472449.1 DUF4136 domain-containing protein [Sulfurimonas sp.]MDD3505981.1 DUF4136 domain-containing protein [Sulfurimonas sp.]